MHHLQREGRGGEREEGGRVGRREEREGGREGERRGREGRREEREGGKERGEGGREGERRGRVERREEKEGGKERGEGGVMWYIALLSLDNIQEVSAKWFVVVHPPLAEWGHMPTAATGTSFLTTPLRVHTSMWAWLLTVWLWPWVRVLYSITRDILSQGKQSAMQEGGTNRQE